MCLRLVSCCCWLVGASLFMGLMLWATVWVPMCEPLPGTLGNVSVLIERGGYDYEWHEAVTEDGYILPLVRLPRSRAGVAASKGPVLMFHGIGSTAGAYLSSGEQSLAFVLADEGYDVWSASNRGDGYAMAHTGGLTPEDDLFWNFTFDQMAQYDVPAQVAFVTQATGWPKVAILGGSQGTTQVFAALSSQRDALAKHVTSFSACMPVAYMGHQRSMMLGIFARLGVASWMAAREASMPVHPFDLKSSACMVNVFPWLYFKLHGLAVGPFGDPNPKVMPDVIHYASGPGSTKNAEHWSQLAVSGRFAMFDYGREGNLKHYGQTWSPHYPIEDIPSDLPVGLFAGLADFVADPRDVETLAELLDTNYLDELNVPHYNHIDVLLGAHADENVFPEILDFLKSHPNSKA